MNYLDLDKNKLNNTVNQLNQLLSNYQVYYQNLRNFHWNVEGQNFFDLHKKFEELYDDARLKIDEVAERILTLRHRPLSRMSDYLARAEITEAGKFENDYRMVETILDNHQKLISNMRNVIREAGKIEDEGTIDLIGGFLADMEKMSWMLDAWKTRKLQEATA